MARPSTLPSRTKSRTSHCPPEVLGLVLCLVCLVFVRLIIGLILLSQSYVLSLSCINGFILDLE